MEGMRKGKTISPVTQNRMQHLLNASRQRYSELSCWNFFVHNQHDANSFLCMFISILYMFRAAMCPSSGKLIFNMTSGICHSV